MDGFSLQQATPLVRYLYKLHTPIICGGSKLYPKFKKEKKNFKVVPIHDFNKSQFTKSNKISY